MDFPESNSHVIVSIGGYELNFRFIGTQVLYIVFNRNLIEILYLGKTVFCLWGREEQNCILVVGREEFQGRGRWGRG